jgi:hypothetical protein
MIFQKLENEQAGYHIDFFLREGAKKQKDIVLLLRKGQSEAIGEIKVTLKDGEILKFCSTKTYLNSLDDFLYDFDPNEVKDLSDYINKDEEKAHDSSRLYFLALAKKLFNYVSTKEFVTLFEHCFDENVLAEKILEIVK